MSRSTKQGGLKGSRTSSRSNSCDTREEECIQCNIKVTEDVKALECDCCSKWQCIKCANIPDMLYDNKEVLERENLRFTCNPCLATGLKKKIGSKSQDSSKLDLVLQKLTKLDSIDHILDKCNTLEGKLNDLDQNLEKRIDERVKGLVESKVEETLHSQIAQEVRSCLDEHRERDQRATNIIVYGVEEPSEEEASVRKISDLQTARDLCTELGVNPSNITRSVRLGEKSLDKPRPWKIILSSASSQKELLRNTWKLESSERFSAASINPDMTKEQREQRRKLVGELKERKRKGEKNLRIRNDRIVKTNSKDSDVGSAQGDTPTQSETEARGEDDPSFREGNEA